MSSFQNMHKKESDRLMSEFETLRAECGEALDLFNKYMVELKDTEIEVKQVIDDGAAEMNSLIENIGGKVDEHTTAIDDLTVEIESMSQIRNNLVELLADVKQSLSTDLDAECTKRLTMDKTIAD